MIKLIKRNEMEYMLIPREGDTEIIAKNIATLEKLNNASLINAYNREAKTGFVGVRTQALHVYSLGQVFMTRFGKSPVVKKKNNFLSLSGTIKEEGIGYSQCINKLL